MNGGVVTDGRRTPATVGVFDIAATVAAGTAALLEPADQYEELRKVEDVRVEEVYVCASYLSQLLMNQV